MSFLNLFRSAPQSRAVTPVDFYCTYQREIAVREERMVTAYAEAKGEKDLRKKLLRLNEAMAFFEEFKTWASKADGGAEWFSQHWEHLHNSKNPDFSYGEQIKEEIAKYEKKISKGAT